MEYGLLERIRLQEDGGWESGCTIIWMRGLALVLIGLVVGVCAYEKALAQPHARPMDFTGRPLAGMVYVDPGGYETEAALAKWVKRGVDFESALPAEGLRHREAPAEASEKMMAPPRVAESFLSSVRFASLRASLG